MLPALKKYVPGVAFKGTRDVRVMDRAKTLQVAVWLHQLDMAMGGEVLASETLEALRHHLDPLLESFLTLRTSNLTFQEVVDCVQKKNHRALQQSLHHLRGCHVHDREVLDGLIKAHREVDKLDKATRKSLKKEIDQRHKSLEMLKECISYYKTQLGQEPSESNTPDDDGQSGHGAQAEMAPAPGADDTPSESTMTPATPASDPPPAEDHTQDMEVDDYGTHPCLSSPISCEDDDLLTGLPQSEATEVESGLAHLTVSSPRAQMVRVRKPPSRRHSPSHTMVTGRHFLWVPPELPGRRREAALPDVEGPVELTTSEDSRATLLQGFFL